MPCRIAQEKEKRRVSICSMHHTGCSRQMLEKNMHHPALAPAHMPELSMTSTYLAEDNQQTCLTAGTITHNHQLPTKLSHISRLSGDRIGMEIKEYLITHQ